MPERQPVADRHLVNQEDDESRWRQSRLAFDPTRRVIRWQQWTIPETRLKRLGNAAIEGQDFTRHSVGPGEIGRLDLIAFRYYEEVNFWWAIAEANDIQNPLTEMYPGQQLLIPRREDIVEALIPQGE